MEKKNKVLSAATGCGPGRAPITAWTGFRMQARLALQAGVPLEGLCWYPIVDYPGWENDRACQTGLWGYCNATGTRLVHEPLAEELLRQSDLFQKHAQADVAGGVLQSNLNNSLPDSLLRSGIGNPTE